jgi:C4-dicarboxylate transporter
MIASMFIDSLGLNVSIPIKIIILTSVVLGALLWGYLDTKLGLFRIEQEKINAQVPQLYTIINLLNEIKNKLNGTT